MTTLTVTSKEMIRHRLCSHLFYILAPDDIVDNFANCTREMPKSFCFYSLIFLPRKSRMQSIVILDALTVCEPLATVWARKRFFPSVWPFMSVEIACIAKLLWALAASVRFLTRVSSKVSFKSASVVECFFTDWTCVWSLSHVDPHVSAEAAHVSEMFVALDAGVRFLSRVNPQVLLEVTKILESFLADGAQMRFVAWVDSKVLSEAARLRELAVALPALEWSFSGVNPHVPIETGHGCKAFEAFAATVRALSGVLSQVKPQKTRFFELTEAFWTRVAPFHFFFSTNWINTFDVTWLTQIS